MSETPDLNKKITRIMTSIETIDSQKFVDGSAVGSEISFAYPTSSVVSTLVSASIEQPTGNIFKTHVAYIDNPSTVTDLTMTFFDAFSTAATPYELWSEVIPAKASTEAGAGKVIVLLSDLFVGGALTVVASNDTVLGAGFTATLSLKSV